MDVARASFFARLRRFVMVLVEEGLALRVGRALGRVGDARVRLTVLFETLRRSAMVVVEAPRTRQSRAKTAPASVILPRQFR